jgi:hypothetical protein
MRLGALPKVVYSVRDLCIPTSVLCMIEVATICVGDL